MTEKFSPDYIPDVSMSEKAIKKLRVDYKKFLKRHNEVEFKFSLKK